MNSILSNIWKKKKPDRFEMFIIFFLLGFRFQRVVAQFVVKFSFLPLKMASYYDIDDILAEEEVI